MAPVLDGGGGRVGGACPRKGGDARGGGGPCSRKGSGRRGGPVRSVKKWRSTRKRRPPTGPNGWRWPPKWITQIRTRSLQGAQAHHPGDGIHEATVVTPPQLAGGHRPTAEARETSCVDQGRRGRRGHRRRRPPRVPYTAASIGEQLLYCFGGRKRLDTQPLSKMSNPCAGF